MNVFVCSSKALIHHQCKTRSSPLTKVLISSTINEFVFYLEGGLKAHKREQKLEEKTQ